MSAKFVSIKDRFNAKWRRDPETGCWLWTAARHINGYGKMYIAGQLVQAHRIGWVLYRAPLTPGLCLNHLCLNKDCVNPYHMEEVTFAQNTAHRNHNRHLLRDPAPKPPRVIPTVKERFDAKWKLVESGCWEWQGAKALSGHSRMSLNGYPAASHRVGYELYVGPIPEGLHIDHLCRNRGCVNPAHLEPVTLAENNRRGIAGKLARERQLAKTHCKRNHPLSGDNLLKSKHQRTCRECSNLRKRARRMNERLMNAGAE